jgi:hypothetical protein
MRKGGLEIGTALPVMLPGNRADEGVLDEIIGPEHVTGQRTGIVPQAGIALSRSRPKLFIGPPMFLAK